MEPTDAAAHALALLDHHQYVVLATADADGAPWVTPVWFAHEGLDRLVWASWPGSRHSRLIHARPEIALTVFDSTVKPGEGEAFYATARAAACADDELDAALAVYDARSRARGVGSWDRSRLTGAARLRLYVADVTEAWVLDPDAAVDERLAVPR